MSKFSLQLRGIREKRGFSQGDLANAINDQLGIKLTRQAISNYENGTSNPDFDKLVALAKFLGVTTDLLLGIVDDANGYPDGYPDGYPTSQKQFNSTTKKVTIANDPQGQYQKAVTKPILVTVDNSGVENIVLVPVKAAAGYLVGHHDPEYIESLPAFSVPTIQNGLFRAFEVQGYSMLSEEGRGLYPSDIVIAQHLNHPVEVRDSRVYVVISREEGIIVKRCLNRIRENNKLICNSDNRNGEYPPIILETEQIQEIWEFKAVISRQIPKPGDLFNRLNNLEARLALIEQQKLN